MVKKLPVYEISAFGEFRGQSEFYANSLGKHVKEHVFTNLPHKHDFYLTLLVTKGSGTHEIDFKNYPVKPGSLFLMQPGQMHYWNLSRNIEGYVFFHSKNFYEEGFTSSRLKDFEFFRSFQSAPYLKIAGSPFANTSALMKEISNEYSREGSFKFQKLHSLVNITYIEIARNYTGGPKVQNLSYFSKVQAFENLVDTNFRELRSPGEYASKLNITEKHLNRMTRACINKTSTQLIADRIVLEAKRMLMQGEFNVTQIADKLGYSDNSYFVRFFKKHNGETPLDFFRRYKKSEKK